MWSHSDLKCSAGFSVLVFKMMLEVKFSLAQKSSNLNGWNCYGATKKSFVFIWKESKVWIKLLTSHELEIHIVGHASLSKPVRIYADYQSWKIKFLNRNFKILKAFLQLSLISLNSVSQHSLSLPKKLSQRHDIEVACTGIIIPHIRRSFYGFLQSFTND